MRGIYIIAGVLAVSVAAFGQQAGSVKSVVPNRPQQTGGGKLVGDVFQSKAAGIALRPPINSTEITRQGIPDLIVEFVNQADQIFLKVGTLELKQPMTLQDTAKEKGILSQTSQGFEQQNPNAQRLRREVQKVGKYEMGLLAYRMSQGTARKLMQQAIIPLTPQYYYVLTMYSPSPKVVGQDVDPTEKLAADTFAEVIESVELIDRAEIVKDQTKRLAETKKLLEGLKAPAVMNKAIVREQWWRLTKDDKDMGYSYVFEERDRMDGREGILVSVRSRTFPGPGQQIDVSSRLFISDGWDHESWSHVVNATVNGKTEESAELGLSDAITRYRVKQEPNLLNTPANTENKKQPDLEELHGYKVQVRTKIGRTLAQPLETELPDGYLPQAIQHLLPRMLSRDSQQGYLFLSYVSEHRQMMRTYVDVLPEKEITIGNRKLQATPVEYKVGLEGVPTTYYIAKDGTYLGSEVRYKQQGQESVIRVMPSDEATLMKLWKNAQLDKPQQSEVPTLPQKRK